MDHGDRTTPTNAQSLHLTVALCAALVLPFLSGCVDEADGAYERADAWASEAEANRPFGVAARMEVSASSYVATLEAKPFGVMAPFQIEPEPRTHRAPAVAFFMNASVDGWGSGLLMVEGRQLFVSEGTWVDLLPSVITYDGDPPDSQPAEAGRVRVVDAVVVEVEDATERGSAYVELEGPWADVANEIFFSDNRSGQPRGFLLEGYDRAGLIVSDGTVLNVTDATLRVDAERVRLTRDTVVRMPELDVPEARFGWAGNDVAGVVQRIADGKQVAEGPDGVFGYGPLHATAHGVRSGHFQLTQLMIDEVPTMNAAVQVQTPSETLVVQREDRAWVHLAYREHSYYGDAVLSDVRVTGAGSEYVEVAIDDVPWLFEELWDTAASAGIAAPFLLVPVAIVSPFIALGEILSCIFDDCARGAYPTWMDAGASDIFSITIDATDARPGTYEPVVVFEGRNYDEVRVPLSFVVEA